MDKSSLIEKLHEAQRLLAEVYSHYAEIDNTTVAKLMSCADDCIWESIDRIKQEV
jgi:hypothetical protein